MPACAFETPFRKLAHITSLMFTHKRALSFSILLACVIKTFMYVFICMYVCIFICMYVCLYVCIHMYVCMHVVCMYLRVCVHASMYLCIYVYVYICICVHMYFCIYVCMYICIYVHMFIHTQTYTHTYIYIGYTQHLSQATCHVLRHASPHVLRLCVVYVYISIYLYICILYVYMSDTPHRMYSNTPRRMQTPLCTCTLCLYNKYQRMLNGT